VIAYNVDGVVFCAQPGGQDMRLPSPRYVRSLVIGPLFAAVLAFPASAQTGSDTNSTSAAGARGQSEVTGGSTGSNPATPNTASDRATPSAQTDSMPAKAESEPGGSQPESNPGLKKAGSAILININKAKQKMIIRRWDRKIRLAGINRSGRIFNAVRNL
jgi:hypothetical protein